MPGKIILAGEGGQGVQKVAEIIARAAQKSGKNATYLPSFGVEQRGGVSLAYIIISSSPISYPRFLKADIALAFSNRSIEALTNILDEKTLLIYDSSAIENSYLEKIKNLPKGKDVQIKNFVAVPSQKIAREKFSLKVANMIMLGALAAHLKEIEFDEIVSAVENQFKDKIKEKPEIKEMNEGALKAGLDLASNFDPEKVEFKGCETKEIEGKFQKENISWERFPEYCKGCGLCILECPVQALKSSEDIGFLGNPLPIVDIQKCIGCIKCQDICPDGAIRVEKSS